MLATTDLHKTFSAHRGEAVRALDGVSLTVPEGKLFTILGESDGITDFMELANDYRSRIGFDRCPQDGEAYLRALIDLAKATFGTA